LLLGAYGGKSDRNLCGDPDADQFRFDVVDAAIYAGDPPHIPKELL